MSDSKQTLSKAEEAAQNTIIPGTEVVPSYGEHIADDLYTEFNSGYGTGLPNFDDTSEEPAIPDGSPPILEPTPEQTRRAPSPLPPPIAPGPLSLTLDKALIFPDTVPATALCSLNYTLNTMGSSITLRRSVQRPVRANGTQGKIEDKDLYDITRPPFNLLSFTIHGKRKSTYPGEGTLRLRMGLRGRYWECRFKDKVMLKGKNGEWVDGAGKLLAKEVNEVIPRKGKGKAIIVDDGVRENPGLTFEERETQDDLLVDLMVAVWCAKTWFAETFESKTSLPSTSETGYSWGTILK